jgi:hypothetical protein
LATASQPNITNVGTLTALSVSGNVTGGNVLTGGQISATGNIRTTGYFFAVQDINVGGDVTATSYTGVSSSVSGNVTSGNIITGGRVIATGNVSANYFIGNGSQLSGIDATSIQNGNSNVLVGAVAGNVSININGISPIALFTPLGMTLTGDQLTTGTLTAGNLLVGGVVSATGDVVGSDVTATANLYYNGNVLVTRSLTVGTRSTPVTITLTTNGSFSVGTRSSGNVTVTTST